MKGAGWWIVAAMVAGGAGVAAADTFGGFAGNEKTYVLGREKVCEPLKVAAGAAKGVPACKVAGTDVMATLSLKSPPPERGSEAQVKATAKGQTITVVGRSGEAIVTWQSFDPVASVVDVWRSQYGRIVAVEYTVRRAGREVHEVVGFDLGVGGGGGGKAGQSDTGGGTTAGTGTGTGTGTGKEIDPVVKKAIDKARKAKGKAAVAAWAKVLELDPESSEARYRRAAAFAGMKKHADAVAALQNLAQSKRADAIEWLVEARFDKSFVKLVGDAGFRDAVGYDRPAGSAYERLMGLGGQWEQSLTPCDRPEMKLVFKRDRTFRLGFRSTCEGMRESFTMKGTWSMTDVAVELLLKKPGGGHDRAPCLLGTDGDEDTLTCHLDADLSFEARPVRR
ncbi:MAG: hypothetical protein K8M05_03920 [Deltaproteobacteria bacterium]|nr:hypothetical protein [Kofleriaceae bacterium]